MVILYVLLVAYILAINFYAYLLVKTLRDKEMQSLSQSADGEEREDTPPQRPPERIKSKLFIVGALGGAITVYACTFLFKYRRSDLALMVFMPLLGVVNIYTWVLLFRSGFSFFLFR